jgi:hypothetical protein
MRYALALLILVHGIAHSAGFAVFWRLITVPELPYRTTVLRNRLDLGHRGIRVYGLVWLLLAVGLVVVASGVVLRSAWWLPTLTILTLVSGFFCALGWPDTRLGVVANVLVVGTVLATFRFGGGSVPVSDGALEELWEARPAAAKEIFESDRLRRHPLPARRYVERVIAPGTPLASKVRLSMDGEIKLDTWHRFRAEQVISESGEFVWAASTSVYGLPVVGADRLLQGRGSMNWKLLGLLPVAAAEGPDVTRSALGRLQAELVSWLPPFLLGDAVSSSSAEGGPLVLHVDAFGERTDIELSADDQGGLRTIRFLRWGNPDGSDHRYEDFGVIVEDEGVFSGFKIPRRIRAGWFFGTERFDSEGEFLRATIREAVFR